MRAIQLTQGKNALIDDEDFNRVSQHKWCANRCRGDWRAMANIKQPDGKWKMQNMSRFIMNPPDGLQVDHRNHNTLDNQKCNLRICTPLQNTMNSKPQKRGASRYKGVYWDIRKHQWVSWVMVNHERIHLGYFYDEVDAAKAYDEAAKEYFGEFAYLNFEKSIEEKFMGLNV